MRNFMLFDLRRWTKRRGNGLVCEVLSNSPCETVADTAWVRLSLGLDATNEHLGAWTWAEPTEAKSKKMLEVRVNRVDELN